MSGSTNTEATSADARRPVVTGASITTGSQIASALAGGFTGLIVARVLGPAGTGVYNVVVAAVTILAIVSALGLDTGTLYYVGRRRWPPANAARQLQVAALLLGLAGCGLGVIGARLAREGLFSDIDTVTIGVGLAAIPFSLSWLYGSSLSLARERYEEAALAPVLQAALGLILTAALASAYGTRGAVTAFTASHAVTAAWLVTTGLRRTRGEAEGWGHLLAGDLLTAVRFGFTANVTAILAVLNRRADLLILNGYAAKATVGHYGVAVSLTTLQLLLPMSLARVLMPRVSSFDGERMTDERSFMIAKSVRHGIILSIASGVSMTLGLLLVPFVFGRDFEPAVTLGWILVPGTAAYGVANVLAATIVGSGRPGYILRAAAIITPVTLALYFTLIPSFEATGAAAASALSYSFTLALYWGGFRKVSGIRGVRALLPGRDEIRDYRELLAGVRSRHDRGDRSDSA